MASLLGIAWLREVGADWESEYHDHSWDDCQPQGEGVVWCGARSAQAIGRHLGDLGLLAGGRPQAALARPWRSRWRRYRAAHDLDRRAYDASWRA